MKGLKTKIIAIFLCAMILFELAPVAYANTGYTEQYLGDGFTRLVLTDTTFAAKTVRTFTVNIQQDSDYAVFLNRTDTTNKTSFGVTFTNGTSTVTLHANPTTGESAYGINKQGDYYIRVGADASGVSPSCALTKGEWTMSVYSFAETAISYIDIRSTTIKVDGSKQAIYPSDYNTYSSNPGTYVNEEMSGTSYAKVEGYTYYGDYANNSLATAFEYGRGIRYLKGQTITYKFNVAEAGSYIINMSNTFYIKARPSVDTTSVLQVTATGNSTIEQSQLWTNATTGSSARITNPLTYEVNLSAGVNTLTVKLKEDVNVEFYIKSLTIEKKVVEYTEQYLGDGFTRLTLNNTAFEAGVAREFKLNIEKDGDYTVFVSRGDSVKSAFSASFTKDSTTKTLFTAGQAESAYTHDYIRVGAGAIGAPTSVSLTKGEWTLNLSAFVAAKVNYIDIRSTTIDVDGSKQAIYPSDFHTYTTAPSLNVNNEMKKTGYSRVGDYTYYADYVNELLAVPFNYGRGIALGQSHNVTYKLNVATAGAYVIRMNTKFYTEAALANETTGTLQVTATGNNAKTLSHTFTSGTAKGATSSVKALRYKVQLAQGVNTLTIKMANAVNIAPYIHSLTISSEENDSSTYSLVIDSVSNYMAAAREAYITEEYADYTTSIIKDYADKVYVGDIPNPVSLSWDAISGAASYTLYVSTSSTFPQDNTIVYEGITTTSKDVYNLFVNTKYYWKVVSDNGITSDTEGFLTANTIRYMNVEGIRNVRDIGGWNGLNQGLVYRGTEMNPVTAIGHYGTANPKYFELTEAGKKVMLEDMGIKTDLDLRAAGADSGYITSSPLGDTVKWANYAAGSYHSYAYKEGKGGNRQKLFELFADPDNYPIYFHCYGGSDRTGTIAFLVEAIAGASEVDLNIDYETTSFSILGARTRVDGGYYFASLMNGLKAYEGNTLQEKAENYAINCVGLNRAQVSNIQSILSGNGVVFEKPADVQIGNNTPITLKNLGSHTVKSVSSSTKDVTYALSNNILSMTLDAVDTYTITFDDDTTIKFNTVGSTPCTQQNLEDKFIRLTLDDGNNSFNANSLYSLKFNVEEAGEYAVFAGKSTEANGFKATVTNGTNTYTLANDAGALADYGNKYVRFGAQSGNASTSVSLTAGEWTLNITPLADTSIDYIDIRSTSIDVDGYPQAVYASDYWLYSTVAASGFVNEKMNTNSIKTAGFNYYGDYANSSLDVVYNYNRPITIGAGNTVSYKLNVQDATGYILYIDGATDDLVVGLNGNDIPLSTTSKGVKTMVQLAQQEYTLTLTATQNTTINALRFEKFYGKTDIVVNAETDYDIDAGHGNGWYDTTPDGYDDQWQKREGYGFVDVYGNSKRVGGAMAYLVNYEWFKYNVNVDYSGYYRILVGLHSIENGGAPAPIEITVNGDAENTVERSIYRSQSTGNTIGATPYDDFGFIWLNKGENTIKIKLNCSNGNAQFDAFRVVCPDVALYQTVQSDASTIECENYDAGSVNTKGPESILMNPGHWAQYTLNTDKAGIYNLTLIANGSEDATYGSPYVVVTVNETNIGTYKITNKNSWSSVGEGKELETVIPDVQLNSGANTIKFEATGNTCSLNRLMYSTASEQKTMAAGAGAYTIKAKFDNWYKGKQYGNNTNTLEAWTADTIENLTFIAAVYNENELVKAETRTADDLDANNTITIQNFALNDGETVKLFVWDNGSYNLIPMFESIIYE